MSKSTGRISQKMIPKEFFVTSGKAISSVSELNAFDIALKDARIAQCNLVPVSSILPPNCKEESWRRIPIGSITYLVLTRMSGKDDITLGTGLAWGWKENGEYGLVAETHGHMKHKELKKSLELRILEMAKTRNIEISRIKYRTEVLRVSADNFGCVLAALVFVP
jgi:arginine decarboxylase